MSNCIKLIVRVLNQQMRCLFLAIQVLISIILLRGCEPFVVDSLEDDSEHPSIVMIVPDIQNYTDGDYKSQYLDSITTFYLNNIEYFAACFQVGDWTNHNKVTEYQNAYKHFFSKFPEGREPYFCLGNHDYGTNGSSDVRQSNLPDYMYPVMNFQMEGCAYENYVRFLNIREKEYAVLDLEFAPRNEVIAWANDVVAEYPTKDFIILTHVFTNKYGQIHDATDDNVYHPGSQKGYVMGGNDYINDSMEIFNKLINNHPNIIMVVCGHTFIPDYIKVGSKKNAFDQDVYYITVNYQHAVEGGRGYVGLLEIGEESYRIRSYNTVDKQYGDIDIVF